MNNYIIVTNNPKWNKENNLEKLILEDYSAIEIMKKVRDYIHKGYKLITHPSIGNIKPHQTPYKSIVITEGKNNIVEYQSLEIIEKCIEATEGHLKITPMIKNTDQKILKDLMFLDYTLIRENLDI